MRDGSRNPLLWSVMRLPAVTAVLLMLGLCACDRRSTPPAKNRPSEPAASISIQSDATPAAAPAPSAAVHPLFVNVAPEAGLTAVQYCGGPNKNHILESTGSGAAWIDYDEDGLLDVFLVNAWALAGDPP